MNTRLGQDSQTATIQRYRRTPERGDTRSQRGTHVSPSCDFFRWGPFGRYHLTLGWTVSPENLFLSQRGDSVCIAKNFRFAHRSGRPRRNAKSSIGRACYRLPPLSRDRPCGRRSSTLFSRHLSLGRDWSEWNEVIVRVPPGVTCPYQETRGSPSSYSRY